MLWWTMADPISNSSKPVVDRLDELIAMYLDQVDRGLPVDPETWIARYPEHAEGLRSFFHDHQAIQGAVRQTKGRLLPSDPLEPVRFEVVGDRYRLSEILGRGPIGLVYRATDLRSGTPVALKLLLGISQADVTTRLRLRNTFQRLATLNHPHLLAPCDHGEHGGTPYIVTTLIEGADLKTLVRRLRRTQSRLNDGPDSTWVHVLDHSKSADQLLGRKALPDLTWPRWGVVARMGLRLAEGLAHAHGHGILHYNIKPHNIVIDFRENAYLSDFGLAAVVAHDETVPPQSEPEALRYLAPERFHGQFDERSDIYGLGLALYELLCLRSAFPIDSEGYGPPPDDRIRRQPPSPRSVDPEIPRGLERIVLGAIAWQPRNRYPTAASLARDLKRWLRYDARGESPLPPSLPRRLIAWMVGCRLIRDIESTLID